jgi:hypothetical protein
MSKLTQNGGRYNSRMRDTGKLFQSASAVEDIYEESHIRV